MVRTERRLEPLLEHRLTLADYKTRALELEGDGPPYLFFHGFSDSADTWRLALDLLARRGRSAVAFDLPGFGTAAPLTADPILSQLDRFGSAALDYAGPGAIVVGNSLGGCMALRLAENSNGQVGAAVALSPAGLDMSRWIDMIEGAALLRPLLALPSPVSRLLVRTVIGRLYQQLAIADPGRVDPNVISQFTAHFRGRETVRDYIAIGRRLRTELRDPFRLAAVDCPLLLIYGSNDRLVPPTGADRVLSEVASARIELLEGCGHCPQIESTERLVELLLELHPGD